MVGVRVLQLLQATPREALYGVRGAFGVDDDGPRDASLETRVAKPGEEEAGQTSATGRLD